VVTDLIDQFARLGTRCSEVHLQSGVQLFQEDGVPLGFRYPPSKPGPLSLDLQGELNALQRLRPGLHWAEAAAAIRVVGREVGR